MKFSNNSVNSANTTPPAAQDLAAAPVQSAALPHSATPQILWNQRCSEASVIEKLKQTPAAYHHFLSLKPDWQTRFMEFCTGLKTLPLTYDPFFKQLFHPDIHPDRLSRFLSCLLESQVTVQSILPAEDHLMDSASLLTMDLLVQLADGSLANVEIQKIPYNFPAQRASCYSADLLLRQYSRQKGTLGKNFSYEDIKQVYTIVLFEKSTKIFHSVPHHYLHHGKTTFPTGLPLKMLQEYILIALDVFRQIRYPDIKAQEEMTVWEAERTAWLGLLTTETIADAELLAAACPWLEEIYKEAAAYRQHPEEVLWMYSETLRELDRNTVRYMIEDLEKDVRELKTALEQEKAALNQKSADLEQERAKSAALQRQLELLQKRLQ